MTRESQPGPHPPRTRGLRGPAARTYSGIYSWFVVLLLWLVCFFSYADRQAFFSVYPLLQKDLRLSTVRLGLLGSSFAVLYGISGPFAGYLVDRIRRKTAILGGLEFWSVLCSLSALSRSFFALLVFRAAEGLGEAIYYPAALSMVSDYHGRATRSRAMGILQTSVYAGTVGGGYWAGLIAQRHGWRMAVLFFGGLGCLLGVALAGLLREPSRGQADLSTDGKRNPIPARQDAPEPHAAFSLAAMRPLLTTPPLPALMGAFACANFVAMALLAWMPAFLYARFHLSLGTAAFDAAVYPQLASMAGSTCGGFLADMQARRSCGGRIRVQFVGVLAGIPFVAICGLSGSLPLVKGALVGWGFFKGLYDSNIFASAFDVVPAPMRGTVSGLMNCVGWLIGGGLAPTAIGLAAASMPLGRALACSSVFYALAAGLLLLSGRRLRAGT
jgi:sugar phosphate permease